MGKTGPLDFNNYSIAIEIKTTSYWQTHTETRESESRSVVPDSATPWTIRFMEFSRPEYWSGWPFPSPGDLPNPGTEPRSPTLQADSLPAEPPGKPTQVCSTDF